jgi:hypothetical protein
MPLTWDHNKQAGRVGTGNWAAELPPLPAIFAAAKEWADALRGVARPWLCWCVDADWCLVQQRLALEVGWTPVVGSDTGAPPPLLPGAIHVDFNRRLALPAMWMHFPLELVFLFADRLAFWHSDFLPDLDAMWELDRRFAAAEDGETHAVHLELGLRDRLACWRRLERAPRRFYELVGVTTRGASRDQFERGCGWWRHIDRHPNFRGEAAGPVYWEHGAGIYTWARRFHGAARRVDIAGLDRHHYSTLAKKDYRPMAGKADELKNYDLDRIIGALGFHDPVDLASLRLEAAAEAARRAGARAASAAPRIDATAA